MELVKPVEPVLWASIVELVIGGTGYGTVEALVTIRNDEMMENSYNNENKKVWCCFCLFLYPVCSDY